MADSASPTPKRRSLRDDDGEDRITRLPDDILSHILSFLPTKYAVLTGILSNRWRSIWTSVPNLDFDDSMRFYPQFDYFPYIDRFMNFVDRVLNLRDNSISVQTLRLKCEFFYEPSNINSWISYVVEHGVREIDICNESDGTLFVLHTTVLNCEKLEVLKLDSNILVHIPDSICLSSIRVLHLTRIQYDGGSSTVERIISSCPVLEELVFEKAFDDYLRSLAINSCSLKSLKIGGSAYSPDTFFGFNVVVDAPNLESVDISYYVSCGVIYLISQSRFLVKANINYVKYEGKYGDPYMPGLNFSELLESISNVNFLTLSENTMNYLGLVTYQCEDLITIPKFGNLIHLEVKMERYGWFILPKMLECLPNLKYAIFHSCKAYESCTHDMPKYVPKCLSMLEIIEIKGFEGRQEEIELVRYILESAMVLKKMTIYSFKMQKSTLLKKLIRIPRASKNSELVFCLFPPSIFLIN